MKGLIIKEPWIDYILDGLKHWEIRGSNTKIRGRVYLIKSGTGMIYGEADLIDSFPVNYELMNKNQNKHRLRFEQWLDMGYSNPHAWVLENPVRYPEPIPYEHKKGAIIWVNIPD
jgi:hypothetical protein